MQLFSLFDHHVYLEMAISKLEKYGVNQASIFAVPLDSRMKTTQLLDPIHHSDSTSLIDIGMALAVAFSVIGTSVGFKLAWGPILWGLISALFGFILGVCIRLIFRKRRKVTLSRPAKPKVILIIECKESQADMIEMILWNHSALGVTQIK
ncbi:MAG TPA: hypothetical protein VK142_02505 [Bacillota bacterium]|nr:hypothetical protein [Bacillota bacterium]